MDISHFSGFYHLLGINIAKAGKEKGVVAVTVTDATKDYIVLMSFDDYSEASYTGSVVIP